MVASVICVPRSSYWRTKPVEESTSVVDDVDALKAKEFRDWVHEELGKSPLNQQGYGLLLERAGNAVISLRERCLARGSETKEVWGRSWLVTLVSHDPSSLLILAMVNTPFLLLFM